jgi:hypothetical protein
MKKIIQISAIYDGEDTVLYALDSNGYVFVTHSPGPETPQSDWQLINSTPFEEWDHIESKEKTK